MIALTMRIGYLGTGAWGYTLAHILASKGHQVTSWSQDQELVKRLSGFGEHPKLPGTPPIPSMRFTSSLEEALYNAEFVVESVTSSGLRTVFSQCAPYLTEKTEAIVITSKGIEQATGLTMPEVAKETLNASFWGKIGLLSGPSFAKEVLLRMPTCIVASAYEKKTMQKIAETFTTPSFRVYPNRDIHGVALGGALKNIFAIPCGFIESLNLGHSTKAALITRGLHEMKKLGAKAGANLETFSGLSGLGDLVLTASSPLSRNFLFGYLLAQGKTIEEALLEIGMVVEGINTTFATLALSRKHGVEMPITQMVEAILLDKIDPKRAIDELMKRSIKEEHL